MFVDPAKIGRVQAVRIAGFGLATFGAEERYDNRRYLLEKISEPALLKIFAEIAPNVSGREAQLEAVDRSFQKRPGIIARVISDKTTAALAVEAARDAIEKTGMAASQLDFIYGATNTGPSYPSLADFVKLGLGARSEAGTNDVTEACSSGLAAVFDAWRGIRAGVFKKAMVVAAENAFSLLKNPDDYRGSNLFGSAAVAIILEAASEEQFLFFEQDSDPYDERITWVRKTDDGFFQEGREVHRFVGEMISERLAKACDRINLDQANVKHAIFHMASGRTIDLLEEKIRKMWPQFSGTIPQNVRTEGNVSAAGALKLLAEEHAAGRIKTGDVVTSYAFGSGISWVGMGYYG